MKKINDKRFLEVSFEETKKERILLDGNINRDEKGKSKIENKQIQSYTIIDHLGTYGLEGYGILPNPNSFGLHDDGTNVFTVRSDDLPFDDVDYSFAVEESTENLVDPAYIYNDWTTIDFDWGKVTGSPAVEGDVFSISAEIEAGYTGVWAYVGFYDSSGNTITQPAAYSNGLTARQTFTTPPAPANTDHIAVY